MTRSGKILSVLVAGTGIFLGLRHAARSLNASVPEDMPADAQFLQSGYDLAHNEAQGEWVACRLNVSERTNWCRVTDQSGHVVYQGDYLPVGSDVPVEAGELRVRTTRPDRLWVSSPVHSSPVPVLPLRSGKVLVPAEDDYALGQRWKADPEEYNRVLETGR